MTQILFCSSYMDIYFLLTRAVGTLQKTNLTIIISLLDTHTFHHFALLRGKKGLKGNENFFSIGGL